MFTEQGVRPAGAAPGLRLCGNGCIVVTHRPTCDRRLIASRRPWEAGRRLLAPWRRNARPAGWA